MKQRIITSVIALSLLSTMTAWGQTSVIKREQAKQKPQVSKAKPQNSYKEKHFIVDSIEYHTRSAKEVLLYSVKKKVNGHFVIPEKVSFEGKEYTVVAINNTLGNKKNLKEVTVPSSLKEMIGRPFSGDTALTTIHIAPGNTTFEIVEHGALMNKAIKTLMWVPTRLTGDYDVPAGTRHINKGAFEDCRISSVTMPSTVESIGEYALSYCKNIQSIIIPPNVKKIDSHVFSGCERLKEIILPDGLEEIGFEQFSCCWALKKLRIPKGVRKIYKFAFWGTRISDFEVDPANPSFSARNGMLCSKDGQTLVRYPTSWRANKELTGFKTIGEFAFYDTSIEDLIIPEGVITIETEAFRESGIKSVNIPNSVVTLKDKAFRDCDKLETIVLPYHLLNTLEKSVFYGCKKLKEITLRFSDGSTKMVPVEEKWMKYAY